MERLLPAAKVCPPPLPAHKAALPRFPRLLFQGLPGEEVRTGPRPLPPPRILITPIEAFNIVWVKLPVLTAIFIASPWILYQVWSFIAPGLYKKERRWAA